MTRRIVPSFVDRVSPSRLHEIMLLEKSKRRPTLVDPGRRRVIEELRVREADREMVAVCCANQ